jgi:hypothetical protein
MKISLTKGFCFLFFTAIALYIPFIFWGGFGTSDDLVLVSEIGTKYLEDLKYNLSRSGHISRPIYGFVQTTLLHWFGDNFIYYNLIRLLFWALFIFLAHRVFHKLIGKNELIFFLFFLMFPIFSSSQLFNSMQSGYILSMIFYLLALRSIQDEKGEFTQKRYFYFLLYSLLALLSCEIVFPLFVFPLLFHKKDISSKGFRMKIFLIVTFCFSIILVLKLLIGPMYQLESVIYGFSLSSHSFFQWVYYFFTISVEIPLLLIEVIPFFFSEPILLSSILILPLFYYIEDERKVVFSKNLFISSISTILACSLIFLISNYPSVTYGLYNKMLLPSHLFVCLILGHICSNLLNSRFSFIAFIIGILWLSSMELQVINSIRSWKLRNDVYKIIVPKLNNYVTNEKNIFVNVPFFLKSNYNNEPVFSLNDDFQGGLILNGYKGNSKGLMLFNSKMIRDSTYWPHHNIINVINEKHIDKFDCIDLNWVNSSDIKLVFYEDINRKSLNRLKYVPFQSECLRSVIRASISNQLKKKLNLN